MSNVSLIDGHIDNAEHCVCCGAVIPEGRQHCVICGYKAESGKQRQIDRIRNMSVEELARFIELCFFEGLLGNRIDDVKSWLEAESQGNEKWLKMCLNDESEVTE